MTTRNTTLTANEIRNLITKDAWLAFEYATDTHYLLIDRKRVAGFTARKYVEQTINKARRMNLGLGGPENFNESQDLIEGLNEAVQNGENPFAGSLITDGKSI
jgi:hypothetical protein